ncbi:hypothetical protein [Solidesulfovibrio alcoholivorans]|uniref:hypothetical protein n=1 Tax=Solidesulfovibrio alcoholivorans TaxID=81406 RepID=UPI000AAE175A|nr:hypothetical protein [Solidesulfovibrio alcoholivorans]
MICMYLNDFVVKFLNKFPADEIEKILITNHDEIEFIEILKIVIKISKLKQNAIESACGFSPKFLTELYTFYGKDDLKPSRKLSFYKRFESYKLLLKMLETFFSNRQLLAINVEEKKLKDIEEKKKKRKEKVINEINNFKNFYISEGLRYKTVFRDKPGRRQNRTFNKK